MFEVFLYPASVREHTLHCAAEPRPKIAREHKPPQKKLDADGINSSAKIMSKLLAKAAKLKM